MPFEQPAAVPYSDGSLSGVFDALAGAKGLMQVLDIQELDMYAKDWVVANATQREMLVTDAHDPKYICAPKAAYVHLSPVPSTQNPQSGA